MFDPPPPDVEVKAGVTTFVTLPSVFDSEGDNVSIIMGTGQPPFIKLVDNKLEISPTIGDSGDYMIKLILKDDALNPQQT